MSKKTTGKESKSSTAKLIKEIRRNTQKVYSSEQKILIVMEGMRAELSVAQVWNLIRITNGIRSSLKPIKRLSGDELREATSDKVKELKKENSLLKESLADLVIRYDIVKKAWMCWIKFYMEEIYETNSR